MPAPVATIPGLEAVASAVETWERETAVSSSSSHGDNRGSNEITSIARERKKSRSCVCLGRLRSGPVRDAARRRRAVMNFFPFLLPLLQVFQLSQNYRGVPSRCARSLSILSFRDETPGVLSSISLPFLQAGSLQDPPYEVNDKKYLLPHASSTLISPACPPHNSAVMEVNWERQATNP